MTHTTRKFAKGAVRDTGDGKFDYYGFRHPLCEQSFAKYMHQHRQMPDGSLRDANNWWGGWDSIISLQSMVRHVEDLQAIHSGLTAIEIRRNGVEKFYLPPNQVAEFLNTIPEDIPVKILGLEECCNAIRFNADAYKLQLLTNSNK